MALNNPKINAKWLMCLLAALLTGGPLRAQQLYTGSASVVADEVDHMYVKAMQFLVRTQSPEGNWPDEPRGDEPALNALAVISLLAHGDDPNFGPYSTTIHRGLDLILKEMDAKTGYIGSTMYNHGFATLALAESYGAVDDPRLGPALQKAVRLIVNAQKANSLHAWRYSPESQDADTTVSGAQMVALFAARNAGMAVPEEAIQDGSEILLVMPDARRRVWLYFAPRAQRHPHRHRLRRSRPGEGKKLGRHSKKPSLFSKTRRPTGPIRSIFSTTPRKPGSTARRSCGRIGTEPTSQSLRATQTPDGNWEGQFGSHLRHGRVAFISGVELSLPAHL